MLATATPHLSLSAAGWQLSFLKWTLPTHRGIEINHMLGWIQSTISDEKHEANLKSSSAFQFAILKLKWFNFSFSKNLPYLKVNLIKKIIWDKTNYSVLIIHYLFKLFIKEVHLSANYLIPCLSFLIQLHKKSVSFQLLSIHILRQWSLLDLTTYCLSMLNNWTAVEAKVLQVFPIFTFLSAGCISSFFDECVTSPLTSLVSSNDFF